MDPADPKIWIAAEVLVERHGEQALAIAKQRAHARVDSADYPSAVMWTHVAEAVEVLLAVEPCDGPVEEVLAALGGVVHDPEVEALLRDDVLDELRRP